MHFLLKYIQEVDMEEIDILEENGEIVGTATVNEAHQNGLLHKVVHVWIVNRRNKLLVQKRSDLKEFCPLMWDVSFAGHVKAGENSLDACEREAKEELGLNIDDDELKFLFSIIENFEEGKIRELADVYILHKDLDLTDLTLDKNEVEEVKWVPFHEFFVTCMTKKFVPHEEEYRLLKEVLK